MVAWIRSLPRHVRELSHGHDPYEMPLEAKIHHESGYNMVVSNTKCYIWHMNDPFVTSLLQNSSNPTCYAFPMPRSTKSSIGTHFDLPKVLLSKTDDHTSLLCCSSDGQLWYWENIELCFADYKDPAKVAIPLLADDECGFIEHVRSVGYFVVTRRTNVFRISIARTVGAAQLSVSQLSVSLPGAVAATLMNKLGISALAGGDQKAIAVTSGPKAFDRSDKWELAVMTGQTLNRWTMHKSGRADKEPEIYLRDMIATQIKQDFPQPDVLAWNPRVRLLDVSHIKNDKLIVLASFFKTAEATTTTPLFYGLFTVSALFGDEYTIEQVKYTQHPAEEDIRPGGHPRFVIPNGGPNIFIVTSNAIIITAASQDQHFEDVITLKKDCIIGFGSKDSKQWSLEMENSSELNLIFRESGYIGVQVSVDPKKTHASFPTDQDGSAELSVSQSTALLRETLEQAVHFGSNPDNPLYFDLSRFERGNLSQAAVEVSRNILRAHVEYIKQAGGDVGFHLNHRIESAESVIKAIRSSHMMPHLSTDARFELCMNVEMLRAAAALWNEFQRLKDSSLPMKLHQPTKHAAIEILNGAAAECLGKSEGDGTEDPLATFVKGRVASLGNYLCKAIHRLAAAGQKHGEAIGTRDLYATVGGAILAALHAAYSYRTTHIELYQLKNDCDIVAWTATDKMSSALNDMYKLLLSECTLEAKHDAKRAKHDDLETIERADRTQLIKTEAGQFADAYLQGYSERLNHMQNSRDPLKRKALHEATSKYETARREIVKALVDIKQLQKAIQLAEKYKDWNTLAELVHSNTDKVDYCMREYKQGFADALFAYYIAHDNKGTLLTIGERYKDELSLYFQHHPHPELSWLHEVYLKDYASAANAAQNGGMEETNVERRMTMLSLAKLLEAASAEDTTSSYRTSFGASSINAMNHIDNELELASLQHWLIQEWESKVGMIKDIDERAKAVIETFGSPVFKKQKALAKVVQQSVETLLRRQTVDSESLVDIVMLQGQHAVHGVDVYQVCLGICLYASDIPDSRRPSILQDTWRRIFITDDLGYNESEQDPTGISSLSERELREKLQQSGMLHAYQAAIRVAGDNLIAAQEKLILNPQEALSTMSKEDFEKRFGPDMAAAVQKDYLLENQELQRRISSMRLNDLWRQAQRLGQLQEEGAESSSLLSTSAGLVGEGDADGDREKDVAMELD
ncbi:hypothetical protein BGZ73_005225 [Actinomortierella ambigua]|nr:hypothetical protein BGZ73_005225 [Actinomortierella ambigua]